MCIVRAGDVIENNDPRFAGKIVEVKTIRQIGNKVYAVYEAGQRHARINTDCIHNDGQKRATGWTLVSYVASREAAE